ncbi:MAG: carbonic anhydrase [Eubacteriaceae bacterium]|nr:carbonic anhydrase [Eubacteriaceae bacterium]
MKTHQPGESIQDAALALQMLKEGNERHLSGNLINRSASGETRGIHAKGQTPFAVVVTCSDSRVVPEIYFDVDMGSIFVIRNAGNIVDATTLGSMEYAVEVLGARLVAVVGHSACGAVKAACEGEPLPQNIQQIIDHIKPSVEISNGDVGVCIDANVSAMVDKIKNNEFVKKHNALVVGARFDIHDGKVAWL